MTNMTELERMKASFACKGLCSSFSYHLDNGNFGELADLFSVDGVFVRNGERLLGRTAILEAYARRPDVTTVHLITNFHLVDLDPTSARGMLYNLVLHSPGPRVAEGKSFDPLSAMRVIEFEDRFAVIDGTWRFAYRNARPVLQSPTWPGSL